MIFNYTTATKGNVAQPTNSLSIGGYKSSSMVKNDDINNLFDEISLYGMSQGRNEYRAIMFTNNTPVVMKNVRMYFDKVGNPFCDFSINVTATVKDEEGNDWMERVADIYSKPMMGDFTNPTIDVPTIIGDISPNSTIGIWVQRSFNKQRVEEEYNKVAVKSNENTRRYIAVEKETEEGYNLVMEWD